jgi:hypothetical protein
LLEAFEVRGGAVERERGMWNQAPRDEARRLFERWRRDGYTKVHLAKHRWEMPSIEHRAVVRASEHVRLEKL